MCVNMYETTTRLIIGRNIFTVLPYLFDMLTYSFFFLYDYSLSMFFSYIVWTFTFLNI